MEKIPFYLVTGFLGSGKTTLLKRFLDQYSGEKKIAVIQNEFAEINIDSRELRKTGKSFELLEMNNGSVFCVCLLGDFVSSLSDFILQHHPDMVVLEASGLSDPISISQVLASPKLKNLLYLAHVYTIADALNFQKTLDRVGRNAHQIRVADTVILNKSDLVSGPLDETEKRIKSLNPFAKIIKTSYCGIDFNKDITSRPPVSPMIDNSIEPAGKPDVESQVIKTTKRISSADLRALLEKWSKTAYRIKGYVQTGDGAVAVQTSFEHVDLLPAPGYNDPTEVIFLGPKMNDSSVQQEFESICIRK
jgi:G3E family GTPase